jgi:Transglutaminase-like superfamily
MKTTGILPAQGNEKVHYENGKTIDIQDIIFRVNKKDIWKQTEKFSAQFSKDLKGLRALWRFVKEGIEYQEDPIGFQYVQHPAALWQSKLGDCKSFTLFIVSVLQNLGIPYLIRFTAYRKGDVTHVYPVAILDGQEVILDAVWDFFDAEKPFYRKEDFKFQKEMSQIVEISGLGAVRSVSETVAAFNAATKDIPNSILKNDITEMSQAAFYRWLGYTVPVSGIGSLETTRAFRPPVLEFDSVGNLIGISFESLKRGVKKAGEVITKAKDAVVSAAQKVAAQLKEGWKKLVNWFFKVAMPNAAPFFLYTFLKKRLNPTIEAKKAKQEVVINWIADVTGTDRTQIQAAIRAEITKKFGKQPELVLNNAAHSTVSGAQIGSLLAALLLALPAINEIISRIAQLFGRKSPNISMDDAGSDDEIQRGSATSDDGANPGGSTPSKVTVPTKTDAEMDDTYYEEKAKTYEKEIIQQNQQDAKAYDKQVDKIVDAGNSSMMIGAALLVLYLVTQK